MAASATIGATPQFCIGNRLVATAVRRTSNIVIPERQSTFKDAKNRQRKLWLIKSSNSDTTAEATSPETEAASVQVAKERQSLISALNVDKAFRGIAITEVDHYERLDLPRECSYDQVRNAYNQKVDELMKQDLEEEELNNNLELLKQSYIILSTPEERRLYDWSVARTVDPDNYRWPFEVDTTQIASDTDQPPPQDPEDVGPTRLVGYFFLGWLLLSFALSIFINS